MFLNLTIISFLIVGSSVPNFREVLDKVILYFFSCMDYLSNLLENEIKRGHLKPLKLGRMPPPLPLIMQFSIVVKHNLALTTILKEFKEILA